MINIQGMIEQNGQLILLNNDVEFREINAETLNHLHAQHENVLDYDSSAVSVDVTINVNEQDIEEIQVNDRKCSY